MSPTQDIPMPTEFVGDVRELEVLEYKVYFTYEVMNKIYLDWLNNNFIEEIILPPK